MWSECVIAHCRERRLFSVDFDALPLFHSPKISRRLNRGFLAALLAHMQKNGLALSSSPTTVLWRSPKEWALLLEKTAQERGLSGSLATIYELTMGDQAMGSELHLMDEATMTRAVEAVNKAADGSPRAILIKNETDWSESAIKFSLDLR